MVEYEPVRFLGGPAHGKLITVPCRTYSWYYLLPPKPFDIGRDPSESPLLWLDEPRSARYWVQWISINAQASRLRVAFPAGYQEFEKATALAKYLMSLWERAETADLLPERVPS